MIRLRTLPVLALALCLALPGIANAGKNKGGKQHPNKIIKQYDTNGNGVIDGDEVDVVKKAFAADPTGPLKQFDTNNDGQLDDTEIAAMKVKKHDKKGKKNKV